MDNLVSVIIPVYNGSKFISKTIHSALEQTHKNIEIIIVNDGSTDDTLKVINSIVDDRITVVTQENKGASAAKEVGLGYANGEYIQFLDADDLLSVDKIEIQVNSLLMQPSMIAVCSTIHFNDGDDYLKNKPSAYEDQFLSSTNDPVEFLINLYGGNNNGGSMIQPNAFLTPISIIKKIGKWDTSISPCPDEDGEYFCRAILASEGIVYTENAVNYYRKFPNKNSLSALKNYQAIERLFRSILLKKEHLSHYTNSNSMKLAIANQLISLAIETYPKYPELAAKINKEVNKLGSFSYTPISGGPLAQKLSKVVGWKIARYIQFKLKNK